MISRLPLKPHETNANLPHRTAWQISGGFMPKNFYVALGVSKGADLNQIKSAYRKIVKKLHPDLARSRASADSFIEIREAYETLMDADKRRLYDASLDQKPISFRFAPELLRRPRRFEQELFPVTSRADAFFEGFIPVFFTSGRSRTPEKDVYLEVTLSPEEARNGGIFPVTVPVLHRCPRCQGESFHTFYLCPLCQGEAVI